MSDSQTLLYNQALAAAGITRRIASPTEASVEAETCELYYETLRRAVLSAAHWPSAQGAFRLTRLAVKDDTTDWQLGDPQPGWTYAHGLPSDYVRARYINNMDVFELSTYVGADQNVQNCIVSNSEFVVMTYTRDETSITKWEYTLRQAMIFAIAGMISYPLTRKLNKSLQLVQQANELIKGARQSIANSEEYSQERVAPWLAMRGSVYNVSLAQHYIYPYGPLLSFQGLITDPSSSHG